MVDDELYWAEFYFDRVLVKSLTDDVITVVTSDVTRPQQLLEYDTSIFAGSTVLSRVRMLRNLTYCSYSRPCLRIQQWRMPAHLQSY